MKTQIEILREALEEIAGNDYSGRMHREIASEALAATAAPADQRGCHRSHPHEKMDAECAQKTAEAKAEFLAYVQPPAPADPTIQESLTVAAPTQPAFTQSTIEKLHRFLDAAAGDGLICAGLDAADLYAEIFPEQYAKANHD